MLRLVRSCGAWEQSRAEQLHPLICQPGAALDMQSGNVGMKLFPGRYEVRHYGDTCLASKQPNEVKESGVSGSLRGAGECAGLETLQNKAADEPDERTGKPDSQHQFDFFKTIPRPRGIHT